MAVYVKAGTLGRASRGLWFNFSASHGRDIFNEVNVGDTVKVTYTEAVVVDVFTPGAAKN